MDKKILFSIFVLIAVVFSFTFVFAADNMQDMAQDAGNTINDSIDKAQNSAGNVGNAVKDAGNEAMNTANNVVNGAKNTINEITEDRNGNDGTNVAATNNDNNYNATRTAGEGTLLGMNSTTWTWVIMGIAAIAIAALVWYYTVQMNNRGYDDEND